jgi:hypothetical protein
MRGQAASILWALLFAVSSPAKAEPVSIRCVDESDSRPYFVTYDLT